MMLLKRLTRSFSTKGLAQCARRGKILEGKHNAVSNWCKKLQRNMKLGATRTYGKETRPVFPVQEVEDFRRYIRENPIAKMYLQAGLDEIPKYVHEYVEAEDGTITALPPRLAINYNITYDQLLDQFAEVTRTPPAFSDEDIIGVPFYALVIDLLNTESGRTFFALEEVNKYLKPIYDVYGKMLDSSDSLAHMNNLPDGWLCDAALARINYNDFICNPQADYYGFTSWHDWFTREIKEQARPFNPNADNEILNNSEYYPNFKMPYLDAKWHDKFWLKDQRYSLAEMFGADSMSFEDQKNLRTYFEGGTVFQGFLNPWCYHRWRSPVSGIVEKCYKIGNSYYAGNPSLSTHLAESYIASQPLLTMTSVRQIYIINTGKPNIGRVAVIEIGMAEVSGIKQFITEGQYIKKGDLLGMFRFGGSSHAFVFDKVAAPHLQFHGIYDREPDGSAKKQMVRSVLATVQ